MKLVCDKSGVILYYISANFKSHFNTLSKPTYFISCSVTENYAAEFYTFVICWQLSSITY